LNDTAQQRFVKAIKEKTQTYAQLTNEQKDVLMLAEEESNDPSKLISYNQQKKKHKK